MNAYILLAAPVLLLAIDWRQTLTIARNPARWREVNPILGEHPSVSRVNAYFALVLAGVLAVGYLLRDWP